MLFRSTFAIQILTDMKKIIVLATVALSALCLPASAQKKKKENNNTKPMSELKLTTELDSASYALGMLIAKNLMSQGADSLNTAAFEQAMKDVLSGKATLIDDKNAGNIAQTYMSQGQKRKADKNLAEGKKFLEANKQKKGVMVTASGLQYEILKQGDGPKPKDLNTQVTAHYHGTLTDGKVFDSSVNRGEPFKTKVGGVIKAWQEALLMMNVGTKLRIYCPSDLAYGERGAGAMIGPNTVLIFEMELISIDN